MNIRLMATIMVAGTTCSLAAADVVTVVNPKTAQVPYDKTASGAQTLRAKLAALGQAPTPMTLGGFQQGIPSGVPGTLPIAANDDCSAATPISGPGPHAFNNVGATTGPQQGLGCGAGSAFQDVWFGWTAGSSGNCVFSLCGGGAAFDTLIAAYAATGCPGAGTALGCNDDSCGLVSQMIFPVTAGTHYMLQIGAYAGGTGSGNFTLNISAPAGNDDCSAPVVISGNGTFPFDNTGASTGSQGQGEAPCLAYGVTGVTNDVWFRWTATATGNAIMSTCGGTGMDSKIAAYPGSSCPGAGTALACNDDTCGLQSSIAFPATTGSVYMLQLGNYPSALGSVGTFSMNVLPPPGPCTPLDDGTTENLLGWTAGGDMVWLNRFGAVSVQSTVSSIDVAWGSALYPGYNPGNGTPTHVFVYQDGVSQDGDPSDATLLLSIPTTVSLVDTDTYVNYPITPLNITGIFFVGSQQAHNAGQYVATMDQTAHPYGPVSWFFGDNTSPLANYNNPGANIQPPYTFDSIGFPSQCLLRVHCSAGPATYLCDPGASGVIACPCANPPSGSGRGCDNSSATGGASITGAGSNSLATPTLAFTTAGEKPTATSILLQGNASIASGVVFGQGVRCAGGLLKRLYVKNAVGGSITAPGAGDPSIPARSATLGDPISAGQSRWYSVYYRDPIVLGGCSAASTFNNTNTAAVVWQ